MKNILICFAAGCLGGLINSVTVWIFGETGITRQLGVAIAPHITPVWLYPRIVWGGIWGLLFLLPLWKIKTITRGTVFSLLPSFVQLFYVLPFQAHKGVGGIALGLCTPLAVIFFNWIWGLSSAAVIRIAK